MAAAVPANPSPPIVLSVRDISNGGMGIMHANFVHVGSGCSFALVGPNRKLILRINGEVVRCSH